ncbi:MAG: hypothetical protein KGN31_00035 [Betaproteobacteria bacterium]|nr:hypothetical protein [Betaproteobacteria bacterium]MDE2422584.1 hypothetical protein [Betaproteobacteria bacterium]
MATDCCQLKIAETNCRRIQLSGIFGQLTQTARDMRWGLTPVPTPEKCSAIQVAPAQKPFASSPEKCYSFSGFYVCTLS